MSPEANSALLPEEKPLAYSFIELPKRFFTLALLALVVVRVAFSYTYELKLITEYDFKC